MIAAGKKCGCPEKSDISASCLSDENQNTEKCVLKSHEPGYKISKGTCDICCEGDLELENKDLRKDIVEEKASKVFSEIVEKGLPYKEIEAIINDNRMIIRVQKDSVIPEEWDPECDCTEGNKEPLSKQNQNLKKSRNDTIFRKVDLNNRNYCRTVTVYPQADGEINSENPEKSNKEKETVVKVKKDKSTNLSVSEKQNQESLNKSADLEDNPNIFVLRIKKRCESEDGKYNIDLEFRTPRPWSKKYFVKPPPPSPSVAKVEESENAVKTRKGKKAKKGKKGKK